MSCTCEQIGMNVSAAIEQMLNTEKNEILVALRKHNSEEFRKFKAAFRFVVMERQTPFTVAISPVNNSNEEISDLIECLIDIPAPLTLQMRGSYFHTGIDKALEKLLVSKTPIVSLDVEDNEIGGDRVLPFTNAVCVNTTLKTLNFPSVVGNSRGAAAAFSKILTENTSISNLYLNDPYNSYGPDLYLGLGTNTSLEVLRIQRIKFEAGRDKKLASELAQNSTLTELALIETTLHDEDGYAILESLKHNQTLISLSLVDNRLDKQAFSNISEVLATTSSLERLDLSGNAIGPETAIFIAMPLIQKLCSITHLVLEHCAIRDVGASMIFAALETNDTVVTLNLERNNITHSGASAAARMLKVNETLTSLNLSCNPLYEEGLFAISEGMKQNNTLKALMLENTCKMSGKTAKQAYLTLLDVRSPLTLLNINFNNICFDIAFSLCEVLQVNSLITTFNLRDRFIKNDTLENAIKGIVERNMHNKKMKEKTLSQRAQEVLEKPNLFICRPQKVIL